MRFFKLLNSAVLQKTIIKKMLHTKIHAKVLIINPTIPVIGIILVIVFVIEAFNISRPKKSKYFNAYFNGGRFNPLLYTQYPPKASEVHIRDREVAIYIPTNPNFKPKIIESIILRSPEAT